MKYVFVLISLVFCSCAGTFASGERFYTQANADYVEWHGGGKPVLIMHGVNHSTPTRAGGSVMGTALGGATGFATAVMTRGLIR